MAERLRPITEIGSRPASSAAASITAWTMARAELGTWRRSERPPREYTTWAAERSPAGAIDSSIRSPSGVTIAASASPDDTTVTGGSPTISEGAASTSITSWVAGGGLPATSAPEVARIRAERVP